MEEVPLHKLVDSVRSNILQDFSDALLRDQGTSVSPSTPAELKQFAQALSAASSRSTGRLLRLLTIAEYARSDFFATQRLLIKRMADQGSALNATSMLLAQTTDASFKVSLPPATPQPALFAGGYSMLPRSCVAPVFGPFDQHIKYQLPASVSLASAVDRALLRSRLPRASLQRVPGGILVSSARLTLLMVLAPSVPGQFSADTVPVWQPAWADVAAPDIWRDNKELEDLRETLMLRATEACHECEQRDAIRLAFEAALLSLRGAAVAAAHLHLLRAQDHFGAQVATCGERSLEPYVSVTLWSQIPAAQRPEFHVFAGLDDPYYLSAQLQGTDSPPLTFSLPELKGPEGPAAILRRLAAVSAPTRVSALATLFNLKTDPTFQRLVAPLLQTPDGALVFDISLRTGLPAVASSPAPVARVLLSELSQAASEAITSPSQPSKALSSLLRACLLSCCHAALSRANLSPTLSRSGVTVADLLLSSPQGGSLILVITAAAAPSTPLLRLPADSPAVAEFVGTNTAAVLDQWRAQANGAALGPRIACAALATALGLTEDEAAVASHQLADTGSCHIAPRDMLSFDLSHRVVNVAELVLDATFTPRQPYPGLVPTLSFPAASPLRLAADIACVSAVSALRSALDELDTTFPIVQGTVSVAPTDPATPLTIPLRLCASGLSLSLIVSCPKPGSPARVSVRVPHGTPRPVARLLAANPFARPPLAQLLFKNGRGLAIFILTVAAAASVARLPGPAWSAEILRLTAGETGAETYVVGSVPVSVPLTSVVSISGRVTRLAGEPVLSFRLSIHPSRPSQAELTPTAARDVAAKAVHEVCRLLPADAVTSSSGMSPALRVPLTALFPTASLLALYLLPPCPISAHGTDLVSAALRACGARLLDAHRDTAFPSGCTWELWDGVGAASRTLKLLPHNGDLLYYYSVQQSDLDALALHEGPDQPHAFHSAQTALFHLIHSNSLTPADARLAITTVAALCLPPGFSHTLCGRIPMKTRNHPLGALILAPNARDPRGVLTRAVSFDAVAQRLDLVVETEHAPQEHPDCPFLILGLSFAVTPSTLYPAQVIGATCTWVHIPDKELALVWRRHIQEAILRTLELPKSLAVVLSVLDAKMLTDLVKPKMGQDS
jgi:hypothetical protein